MTDPHFHEEHVVERPATRRIVTTETRRSGGYGANPAALMVAAVLAVLIIVLIFGFLL